MEECHYSCVVCVCFFFFPVGYTGEKVFLNISEQEISGRAQYFRLEGLVDVCFRSSAANILLRQ